MLRLLYNLLWYPAIPFALAAAGARDPQDRRERLGSIATDGAAAGMRIWIHAASVGEIEAVRPVAIGLLRELEGAHMTITTMTATGRDAARRRIPGASVHTLAPLDCPATVRRFIRRVRPELVIIGETELWPNYFFEARRIGAKIAIVNGRMSERSLARYRRGRSLFGRALESADMVLAQTADDARRYTALGAREGIVFVTGNTKFDLGSAEAGLETRRALELFAADRPILVAGSTAPGEETVVIAAWQKLRDRFPNLALVIAPRHPARRPEVEDALNAASVKFIRASELDDAANPTAARVLLLDTMGELRGLYRHAAIVFVGGSLFPGRGGQNVGEPAAAGAPVLFGPHHENQREMAAGLLEAGGALVVRDAAELADACARWLSDESARLDAGRCAKAAADKASGGAGKTLVHLRRLMAGA